MEAWGITHNGNVRDINQDIYKIHIDDENNIAVIVVCDGMGGANAGNIASNQAAEVFLTHVNKRINGKTHGLVLDEIAEIAADAAVEANDDVYDTAQTDIELSGMGTTLVALISTDVGETVINIGDSRAYHITPNGISQITKDHSVVEDMIDRGEITRKQAAKHPRKNLITRAIGAERYIESDVFMQTIDKGDIVLLCSDGLTNVVTDNEILGELRNNQSLKDICQSLVDKTLSRGAPDNVTIALYKK